MCLAVPMQIIEKNGVEGKVSAGSVDYDIYLSLVPDANVGDYVIVHAGFAIKTLDKEDADETIRLFKEMAEQKK